MPESLMTFGKANIDTTTADTTWQDNVSEPLARKFFQKMVDQSFGFTKNARAVPVVGPTLPIPSIAINAKLAMGLAESASLTDTSDLSSATFAGRTLTPVNFRALMPISRLTFQETNLEGKNINQVLTSGLVTECGNLLEETACRSAAGGSTPGGYGTDMLSLLDGYPELIANAGNVYDHQGGYINTRLFREMWRAVPDKWKGPNKSDWRFYCHGDVLILLQDLMAQRGTAMGDRWVETETGMRTPFGVECVNCNYMDTELAGVLTQSESTSTFTQIVLARPSNLWIGYRPQMRVEERVHPESHLSYVAVYGEVGFEIENPDATVIGRNVLLDVSYNAGES